MRENEAQFLGEFFELISKYDVYFGSSNERNIKIYVKNRLIGEMVNKDGNTSIDICLTPEL